MPHIAFLFPGQGSQSVGMMDGFEDQAAIVAETFREASSVLGYDLWNVTAEGPDAELNRTEVTQPALLAAGIATWRVWTALGGKTPDFMAGHSLGEYSALVAAGALHFTDAIRLVAERGRLMQQAVPAGSGAMAAIIGLDNSILENVCEEAGQGQVVSCANFNSPGQVVIAGNREAVDRACDLARAAGARRAIPLAVSVPSHCALMKPAAEALQRIIREVDIAVPRVPVVHNVDVAVHDDPEEIRAALVRQLWQPVRWSATIEKLIAQGVRRFAECGPGKVLTGLNRRISRDVESVPLDSASAVAAAVNNGS